MLQCFTKRASECSGYCCCFQSLCQFLLIAKAFLEPEATKVLYRSIKGYVTNKRLIPTLLKQFDTKKQYWNIIKIIGKITLNVISIFYIL